MIAGDQASPDPQPEPQEERLFRPPPREAEKYPERYCAVCGATLDPSKWAQRGLPGVCDEDAAAYQARL